MQTKQGKGSPNNINSQKPTASRNGTPQLSARTVNNTAEGEEGWLEPPPQDKVSTQCSIQWHIQTVDMLGAVTLCSCSVCTCTHSSVDVVYLKSIVCHCENGHGELTGRGRVKDGGRVRERS